MTGIPPLHQAVALLFVPLPKCGNCGAELVRKGEPCFVCERKAEGK